MYVCIYICVYIYAYMCLMYMPKDFHFIFSVPYIYIYFFFFHLFCFIYFLLICVYLCTETSSLTYFVYKLNCFPRLCHTLGVITVYECVLCLNYVLLNVSLHFVTSTSIVHVCK